MKRLINYRIVALIAALAIKTASIAVYADGPDPIPLTPIDGNIGNNGEGHRNPIQPPLATIEDHILCIYANAEKQVSIFPVDYDDETDPLYTTYVSENTYSCVLPSWLIGVYAIEIEINGIVFVGEIEL